MLRRKFTGAFGELLAQQPPRDKAALQATDVLGPAVIPQQPAEPVGDRLILGLSQECARHAVVLGHPRHLRSPPLFGFALLEVNDPVERGRAQFIERDSAVNDTTIAPDAAAVAQLPQQEMRGIEVCLALLFQGVDHSMPC